MISYYKRKNDLMILKMMKNNHENLLMKIEIKKLNK